MNSPKQITYSTCFFRIKSKFPPEKYIEWIKNFMYITSFQNFNLVFYTNIESVGDIQKINTNNIKIVIINYEDFFCNKYKNEWIKNKEKAIDIQEKENDWKLNMIWSEKIYFVRYTIKNRFFPETLYYGWCDVGYFRNRINDVSINKLTKWSKSINLNLDKIHYGWINNHGIAGGFFILNKKNIDWLFEIYMTELQISFQENKYVKDDQQILMKVWEKNKNRFELHYENFAKYDSWFMFQRILFNS